MVDCRRPGGAGLALGEDSSERLAKAVAHEGVYDWVEGAAGVGHEASDNLGDVRHVGVLSVGREVVSQVNAVDWQPTDGEHGNGGHDHLGHSASEFHRLREVLLQESGTDASPQRVCHQRIEDDNDDEWRHVVAEEDTERIGLAAEAVSEVDDAEQLVATVVPVLHQAR